MTTVDIERIPVIDTDVPWDPPSRDVVRDEVVEQGA